MKKKFYLTLIAVLGVLIKVMDYFIPFLNELSYAIKPFKSYGDYQNYIKTKEQYSNKTKKDK